MRLRFAALVLVAAGAAVAEPVLRVEAIGGSVQSDHLGEVRKLALGDVVGEREVLRLDADARLVLHFAPQGLIELGPGAVLAIEKLPPATDAADLRSILNLENGYLHLLWQRPEAPWPLYLYAAGQRASIVSGEYFFERRAELLRSCVAAGQLVVSSISGDAVETLRPSACYPALAAGLPKPQPRAIEAWAAVRRDFMLEPRPELALAPLQSLAPPVELTADGSSIAAATALAAPAVTAKGGSPTAARALPSPTPLPALALLPAPRLAPVASPDALPPPVPTTDSEPQWAVLVGSYADPQNAAQVQSRLIAAGYTPFLRVKNVDGKTWNSVQIRGFATREAAQARLDEISVKLALPNLRVVFLQ